MLGRTDSRRRLLFLLVTFAVVAASLLTRLAYWQVGQRDRLAQEAFAQTTMRQEAPSRRGDIYDRSGVVVLATTVDRERLAAMPSELPSVRRREVATELVELLRLEGDEAKALIERMSSGRKYIVLAHGLDRKTADRIRAAAASKRVEAVLLESEPLRVYPHEGGGPDSTLAAQLLGFVNRDGQGQYGVEQYYQEMLGGRPRVVHAQKDVAARAIPDTIVVEDPGTPGEDLRLTIDAGLQLAIEQEVLAAWAADKAKSVSAVVMDPYTGEVLAQATYPSFDGNAYQTVAATDPDRFIDPVVSSVYEPGSVFKMLTAIAGLETKTVTTKTKIKDIGTLKLDRGKTHVDDADRKGMGWMTFEDAIAYSRNVVAAKVALDLGETTAESSTILHDTWSRLGFGQKTGIDVAGEVRGIVNDPTITAWRQIDLANGSFGQGIAVTPIQLASGLLRDGQWRDARPAARREGDRLSRGPAGAARRGDRRNPVGDARQDDEARRDRGPVLPRSNAGQGLRGRRQDRNGADLGPDRAEGQGGLEAQPVQLQLRRVHRTRCRHPGPRRLGEDQRGDPDGRPGRPARDAGHVVRAVPADRDRCDHPSGAAAGTPAADRTHGRRPVTTSYATLDSVTVPASQPPPGDGAADPGLTADDLVAATDGRLLTRSARSVLGAAVDSREVMRGNLFVALPGERTDGHAFVADAVAGGAAAILVSRSLDGSMARRTRPRRGRCHGHPGRRHAACLPADRRRLADAGSIRSSSG